MSSAQPQLCKGAPSQSSASDVCQHVAVIRVTQGTGEGLQTDWAVLLFVYSSNL